MTIQDLLQLTINRRASDLHLVAGYPAMLRVDGKLEPVDQNVLDEGRAENLLFPLLTSDQKEIFLANHELDFGYNFADNRFRINFYFQKNTVAAAFRLISAVKNIDELLLPPICHQFAQLHQGFILVTGPTGHGKSTTIAAILEEINQNSGGHILTIEDPIEYVYPAGQALISQREVSSDTHSWLNALRAALREDPNTVLVGEMRDFETIAAALTIAETGHLVFATLHTNSAAQSIDRIVDVFPENQQAQIRLQLSNTLEAIISQRLLPAIGGGRVPAAEVLIATPAVRAIIREGKTHMIDNVIQTSRDAGMITLDFSLAQLMITGKISYETAMAYANSPDEVGRMAKIK